MNFSSTNPIGGKNLTFSSTNPFGGKKVAKIGPCSSNPSEGTSAFNQPFRLKPVSPRREPSKTRKRSYEHGKRILIEKSTCDLEHLGGLGPEMIKNGTETDHFEYLGGLGSEMAPIWPFGASAWPGPETTPRWSISESLGNRKSVQKWGTSAFKQPFRGGLLNLIGPRRGTGRVSLMKFSSTNPIGGKNQIFSSTNPFSGKKVTIVQRFFK